MSWATTFEAIGGVATPIAVLGVGYFLDKRIKAVEASEWRHQELIKARMDLFRELSPLINDIMCYMTFIGGWARMTPAEIVARKRQVDRLFFSSEPLFTAEVRATYDAYMDLCFETFGEWGKDARIRSGWGRRRQAWSGSEWDEGWGAMFTYDRGMTVTPEEQTSIRVAAADLLSALADDIKIIPVRVGYGSTRVSGSAH